MAHEGGNLFSFVEAYLRRAGVDDPDAIADATISVERPSSMPDPQYVSKELFDQTVASIHQKIDGQTALIQAEMGTMRAEIKSDVQGLLTPIGQDLAVLKDRSNNQFAWNVAIVGGIIAGIFATVITNFINK